MASAIPQDVIIIWPGNHGDIPSGWGRVTDLDTIFGKGTADGVNPNVTGGATTHTHASSHTHSLNSHSHTGTSGAHSVYVNHSAPHLQGPATGHTHTYTTGSVGGTSGGGPAWGAVSSDPEYIDVIYIASDGTPTGFPQNSMVLMNTSTAQAGWSQHSASKDKFLRGAAGSGNGGGTGGSATHTHGGAHTHSSPNHDHADATASTSAAGDGARDILASPQGSTGTHYHTASMSSSGSNTSGSTTPTHSSTNGQPDFHTLWGITNGGGDDFLKGAICMWLGTLGNIPDDWELCDGTEGTDGEDTPDMRGKFVKLADSSGDIGDTGGDDNHTHAGDAAHTHSSTSHTHSVTLGSQIGGTGAAAWVNAAAAPNKTHSHAAAASNATDPGLASANMTTDSNSDTQPAFRTVAFIQSPGGEVGASVHQFGANF